MLVPVSFFWMAISTREIFFPGRVLNQAFPRYLTD